MADRFHDAGSTGIVCRGRTLLDLDRMLLHSPPLVQRRR
jgi:hypothetical protein